MSRREGEKEKRRGRKIWGRRGWEEERGEEGGGVEERNRR